VLFTKGMVSVQHEKKFRQQDIQKDDVTTSCSLQAKP